MGFVMLYIESMLGYMIVAIPFYIMGRVIFIKKKKIQVKKMREAILGIFVLYIAGLASQTIIPNWISGVDSETGKFFFEIYLPTRDTNLIPFHTISSYFSLTNDYVDNWSGVSLLNIAGNIFIFSPIGFFVPLLWKNWRSFKKILLLGFAVTFSIEFLQLFIGRSTDIDDIILNTIGVMIGYAIFGLYKFIKQQKTREPR